MAQNGQNNDRRYYLFALKIAGNFGATIAAPVVLFAFGGKWLDSKYGTGMRYTAIGFILAAVLSGRLLYRKAKQYGREYQDLTKP